MIAATKKLPTLSTEQPSNATASESVEDQLRKINRVPTQNLCRSSNEPNEKKELATLIALCSRFAPERPSRPVGPTSHDSPRRRPAFSQTLTNVYVDAANALAGTQNVELDEERKLRQVLRRLGCSDLWPAGGAEHGGGLGSSAVNSRGLVLVPILAGPGRLSAITEVTRTGSQADRIAARTIAARLAVRTVGIWQTAEDDPFVPSAAVERSTGARPERLGRSGPGWISAHIGCRCEIVYRFEPIAGPIAGRRY